MKKIRVLLVAVIIIFVAIQFIPSGMPENQAEDEKAIVHSGLVGENVMNILKTSCFDCHSNQTNFPWYARISPASLLLANHIQEGKSHLNFSEWESYSKREKIGMLNDISDEVESGNMPLKSYLLIHKDAVLDEAKIKLLTDWAEEATGKLME